MDAMDRLSQLFVLDTRSTMGFLFWGNFTLAILIFAFLLSNYRNSSKKYFIVFGFSIIFRAVAWFVFFLREDKLIYSTANILIPNILFLISYYLESVAILLIIKSKQAGWYAAQLAIFVFGLISFLVIVLLGYAINLRIATISFFIFLIMLLPTCLFLKELRTSLFRKILGWNYIIILIVLLIRSVAPLLNTTTSVYGNDPVQKVIFLVIFLVLISSGVGYILLMQEEKENQIKKLLNDKDAFFSIIAHDLRGSFTGVLGLSEMLLEESTKMQREEREEFVHLIHQSSKNTFTLLENLLKWAQSQTGRIDFNPGQVDFTALLSRIITQIASQAQQKNISIVSTLNHQCYIVADENMLETIFRNLISNAIKFTHSNGTVSIAMNTEVSHSVFVVADNGIGIAPEKIETLFSVDSKKSTNGTHKEAGTGLGLILCKDFVQKHQGNIWVESKANCGTSFMFSIPNPKQ